MGLAAFIFFVVPWMALAAWLFDLPSVLRLGVPPTPWRPLTDYPDPLNDQRRAANPHNTPADSATGAGGADKNTPLVVA